MISRPGYDPQRITPVVLARLAWRTAVADRRTYRGEPGRSASDILASIFPSLADPVFVIGAPRSGTTFLGDCVGALPGVSYHFEPIATKAAARWVYEGAWSEWKARLYYRAVYRWLLRIRGDGGKRFSEKTPRNCFLIDFLRRNFPGARFLYIVRDGRDAALSHRKMPWLQSASAGSDRWEPGGYAYGPYPRFWVEPDRREEFIRTSDLHRCIWAWRRHNEAALEHFERIPDRILTIPYEGLVRDPDLEGARILDFLEIWTPACRERFHTRVRQASQASIGRWRQELTPSECEIVEQEAGTLLDHFGYLGAEEDHQ